MSRVRHQFKAVPFGSKGGETDGHTQGYKNPPVPRRLVGESQVSPSLSPAYPISGTNMPRTWLVGESREIRIGTKAGLQLCRLPVRSQVRSGLTHTGPVAEPTEENIVTATDLSSSAAYVPDRPVNSHRETSSP